MKSKLLLILICIGMAVALLWDLVPEEGAGSRFRLLPLSGPRFQMRDVPLNDTEKATFGRAEVTKRLIRIQGQPPLLLTAIDGGRNQHAVHDPIYCLRGAGWGIVAESPMTIRGGTARWMRLRRKAGSDSEIETLCWFSNGNERYSSPLQGWGDGILCRMTFGHARSAPVLVLLRTIGDAETFPDWDQILSDLPCLTDH